MIIWEQLTLTALQDYQRQMLAKAGFELKKLWIIKENEIKMRKVHNM